MQDFLSLLRDVLACLRASELGAAARRVREAANAQAEASHTCRSTAIGEINRVLHEAKRQREELRKAVHDLPAPDRLFAEVQIEAVIDSILNGEIVRLREAKRRSAKAT